MNMEKNTVKEVIRGPIYSKEQVPASYCARYARMAAEDLFGLKYPTAHAWKMRSAQEVGTIPVSSSQELEELVSAGIVKKGMLVGFNYKFTAPTNRKAALNEGADYTHMTLLIDTESEGGPYFADKFKSKTRPRISLAKIPGLLHSLKPREVLYLRGHPFFDNV